MKAVTALVVLMMPDDFDHERFEPSGFTDFTDLAKDVAFYSLQDGVTTDAVVAGADPGDWGYDEWIWGYDDQQHHVGDNCSERHELVASHRHGHYVACGRDYMAGTICHEVAGHEIGGCKG